MLLAAAAWVTVTVAVSDVDLEGYNLYGLTYGAINMAAGVFMIGGTMREGFLEKEVGTMGAFTRASLAALILTVFNAVSAGLITFMGDNFHLPFGPPRVLSNGNLAIADTTELYFGVWATFISGAIALMTVSHTIKIANTGASVCYPAVVVFGGSLLGLLDLVEPQKKDLENAQTGLIIMSVNCALCLPLMFDYGTVSMMRKLHSLVVMGLTIAMFAWLTYDGPIYQLGNGYFGFVVGALASVYLYACMLYRDS